MQLQCVLGSDLPSMRCGAVRCGAQIVLDLKDFPGTYRALVLPELQKGRMLLDANERR